MGFETKLSVTSIPGTVIFILNSELVYRSSPGRLFRVPAEARTDLFSIPGVFRSFLFRARKYIECAVLHDGGYRKTLEEYIAGKWVTAEVSRSECDNLLKDSLSSSGAPKTLIVTIYYGVRAGGWASYRKS